MHGPGFIAHTHVQGARTFEENSRLWMELRWPFNSLHFPDFSQGAYANVGHFIFSGDKTISAALKKQTSLRRGGGCG